MKDTRQNALCSFFFPFLSVYNRYMLKKKKRSSNMIWRQ
ncbi:hypothetical protein LL3_02087 [Bacillus amyloliquefaciens LL3]|nr:hypothetical protein LL3_02087 [Bacillus amyloliquefaciens LL3]